MAYDLEHWVLVMRRLKNSNKIQSKDQSLLFRYGFEKYQNLVQDLMVEKFLLIQKISKTIAIKTLFNFWEIIQMSEKKDLINSKVN